MGLRAGAVAIALFACGAVLMGERPAFDADGAVLVDFLSENRTRVQLSVAVDAVAAALLLWFLATIVAVARSTAAVTAAMLGGAFLILFMADISALAVAALRAGEVSEETAVAFQDFELLAMGVAAPAAAGMLVALGRLDLWPAWLRRLAPFAAALYALRTGTLFTTDGPFAADGLLGIYVPVIALTSWIFAASVTSRAPPAPA